MPKTTPKDYRVHLKDIKKDLLKEYKGKKKAPTKALMEMGNVWVKAGEYIEKRLAEGDSFKMPHGLGTIKLIRRKVRSSQKKRTINQAESIKQGKIVTYRNLHTDGYYATHMHVKTKYGGKFSTIYTFRPFPKHTSYLASRLKTEDLIYKYPEGEPKKLYQCK